MSNLTGQLTLKVREVQAILVKTVI